MSRTTLVNDAIGAFERSALSEPVWTKSSYSEAAGNACVEVAACDGEAVAIRDSVQPARSIRASRAALDALITGLRTGALDNPRG
ncbi:DUF397 domain-containing protein [Streptomyces albus]|uniref:DUF397 domain-containing protein n=1 Tax=Streptomyces albus TaxID=1888 RepID=UPI001ABF4131|nr:DUF397 domain-containing protein [Streptomyces albus]